MLHFSLSKQVRCAHQPKRIEIKQWLQHALIYSYKNIYIDISIVNSLKSASLNQEFRSKKGPTNVISLEYSNTRNEFAFLTGELVLCDQVIIAEALQQNKNIMAHYAHMIVHGMLHLQGLDHQDSDTADHMEKLEKKIMHDLGFPNPYKE